VQLHERKSLVVLCTWLQALCRLLPERLRKSWALHKLSMQAQHMWLPQALCKSVQSKSLLAPHISLEQQWLVPHMSQRASPLTERMTQTQFDQ
jgi:hypothetical protein